MVILLKIKRRDFFQRDSIPILVSSRTEDHFRWEQVAMVLTRDPRLGAHSSVLSSVYVYVCTSVHIQRCFLSHLQFLRTSDAKLAKLRPKWLLGLL